MAEVHTKQADADDVEGGDARRLETEHDHFIDVVEGGEGASFGSEFEARVGDAQRVVEEMVDHETQDGQAAPNHRFRGGFCLHIAVELVALSSSGAILNHKLDRGENVEAEQADEPEPSDPEELFIIVEKLRVRVDFLRAREHLEVAGEVGDYEAEQAQAREGDDPLFSDGGMPELEEEIHGKIGLSERAFGALPPRDTTSGLVLWHFSGACKQRCTPGRPKKCDLQGGQGGGVQSGLGLSRLHGSEEMGVEETILWRGGAGSRGDAEGEGSVHRRLF